jgi:ERCC4-type nuclease
VPTVNELHLWIMQSWPGIGPATADAILKHFGRIPLKWTCTLSELMSVPRLGKKNAHEMYESLAEMSEQQDRARDIVTSSVERHTADLTTLPESNEFDVMREMLRYGRRGY